MGFWGFGEMCIRDSSYVVKDWQTAIDGLNVVKGVYMEVDVDAKQHVVEANYVLDICRQGNTPLCAAVIGGRPADDDFPKYLQRFRGNRFLKGVRQVLHSDSAKDVYKRQRREGNRAKR